MNAERELAAMEMTRVVPATRAALFEFLSDFRNERFFGLTIRSCRVEKPASPAREIGEGTEFRFDYRILGLVLGTTFRLEDVVANERFLLRSLRGGVPFTMGFGFADAGGGCRVTVRTALVDRCWLRPLRAPVAAAVRRDMEAYLDALVLYAKKTAP